MDKGREVAVAELLRRDVHGDRQREVPARRLAAGFAQRPLGQRLDAAMLLRERDEDIGADRAARRVRPARQRLEPDHRAVGADLGLVMQFQRAEMDGMPQVAQQNLIRPRLAVDGHSDHRVRGAGPVVRGARPVPAVKFHCRIDSPSNCRTHRMQGPAPCGCRTGRVSAKI